MDAHAKLMEIVEGARGYSLERFGDVTYAETDLELRRLRDEHQAWLAARQLAAGAPRMEAALERLWNAVRAYGRIGTEGSELLEAMSEAKAVLVDVRDPEPHTRPRRHERRDDDAAREADVDCGTGQTV